MIDLRLLPEAIAFSDLTIVDMENGRGVRISHDALGGSIEIRGDCRIGSLGGELRHAGRDDDLDHLRQH